MNAFLKAAQDAAKGYWTGPTARKRPKTAPALAPGNSWPRPETGSLSETPHIPQRVQAGSYYEKVDCKYLPADGRVTADALYRYGLQAWLAGRIGAAGSSTSW